MYGYLQLDGWHGRTQQRVAIVRETAKRYRIRALSATRLGGRNRWLPAGQETYVPKSAIRLVAVPDVEVIGPGEPRVWKQNPF